ncbi:MAG TPA: hypothetical protein VEX87_22380 [Skermanella sp.]|nr:hypothetical protein [Skermanella sp.]
MNILHGQDQRRRGLAARDAADDGNRLRQSGALAAQMARQRQGQ